MRLRVDLPKLPDSYVRVNLRGADIGVAEKFFYVQDVCAGFVH